MRDKARNMPDYGEIGLGLAAVAPGIAMQNSGA